MVNEGIEITLIDGGTYVGTVEVVAVLIVVSGGCFQDMKVGIGLVGYDKMGSVRVANAYRKVHTFVGASLHSIEM